jgi:hypothetical protein
LPTRTLTFDLSDHAATRFDLADEAIRRTVEKLVYAELYTPSVADRAYRELRHTDVDPSAVKVSS